MLISSILERFLRLGLNGLVLNLPHVCWEVAQNVIERHLIVNHLVFEGSRVEISQVLVRPGVGCNLMALSNHALKYDQFQVSISIPTIKLLNCCSTRRKLRGESLFNLRRTVDT